MFWQGQSEPHISLSRGQVLGRADLVKLLRVTCQTKKSIFLESTHAGRTCLIYSKGGVGNKQRGGGCMCMFVTERVRCVCASVCVPIIHMGVYVCVYVYMCAFVCVSWGGRGGLISVRTPFSGLFHSHTMTNGVFRTL